jgi:hypothetical protein
MKGNYYLKIINNPKVIELIKAGKLPKFKQFTSTRVEEWVYREVLKIHPDFSYLIASKAYNILKESGIDINSRNFIEAYDYWTERFGEEALIHLPQNQERSSLFK